MKTKLLIAFLGLTLFSSSYAQVEATSFMTDLNEPSAIVNQGNVLYVQGPKEIYRIDTALDNPSATVVYTAPTDYYMSNLAVDGNKLYVSEEHYDDELDEFFGGRIISIDLTVAAVEPVVIYTTTRYISALAVKGPFIFFASETDPVGDDNFIVQIQRIDTTTEVAMPSLFVDQLTQDNAVNDMHFNGNVLLMSVGGDSVVYSHDITSGSGSATAMLTGLSFNKGLFVSGNTLFTAEGNSIRTRSFDNASTWASVAVNTAFQDSNNGIPFNANFRDVVLIGDKLYMTLQNQGRVMMIQDTALSAKDFESLKGISIYNSRTELNINGLESNQMAAIYNISGQELVSKQVSASANSFDISSFSNGVYLVKLENGTVFKFVK
ncbi:T9SS type A sorting domain-containing protein [Flavobacterium sp. PLA-1-15]|uniref:T9SS type A sorting domain-containing protein n=1 Tax=Flavobacterium sp. PLA-1-15 TaxID=3380533 RepID=UPI003B770B70